MQQEELIESAKRLAAERVTERMDLDEKIDVLEISMMELLDLQVMTPPIGRIASIVTGGASKATGQWLMGDDPRLPQMPKKPTLVDFFKYRILLDKYGGSHLMQSAKLALENGLPGKTVLACLLHDISVIGLIRTDHGYWGAQLVEPYVDEEISWAIRYHQALRFLPSPELGYEYPASYLEVFGKDYQPQEYITKTWDYCQNHKWYMTAMQICLNDLYSFDPNKQVEIEEFEEVIATHFKQPEEGLGFDGSPVAHMWRTMIWPNNFL